MLIVLGRFRIVERYETRFPPTYLEELLLNSVEIGLGYNSYELNIPGKGWMGLQHQPNGIIVDGRPISCSYEIKFNELSAREIDFIITCKNAPPNLKDMVWHLDMPHEWRRQIVAAQGVWLVKTKLPEDLIRKVGAFLLPS